MVRADKGAVLVLSPYELMAAATPRRVTLDRDGLVATEDGVRLPPTVGDWLLVDDTDDGPRARTLATRRTALVRDSAGATSRVQALAANIDIVLVVEHLDPDPQLGRVERLLALAWRSGAQPVVVLTKADLVPDAAGMAEEVAAVALAGRDVMATGGQRSDGRGRHTTTHRELVRLGAGAMLIDTPGIRGVGLVADGDALDTTFADVAELALACRFADCHHAGEPGCAIRAALDSGELSLRRYESWRRLAREAAYQARRTDAHLAALEKRRWKAQTRQYQRGLQGPGHPRG